MDVSKNGPNEFEKTPKNRRPFWTTLISFCTSRGRLFVPGMSTGAIQSINKNEHKAGK